jgi:glyoxylase-like metal-dependent hydrolase (beta-lactamase superfamily II)
LVSGSDAESEDKRMKLHTINTGNFKLDGGAMFGVVPKSIWHPLQPADENNLIDLAMRCLLVENGERLILIDNGLGNKQDERFLRHYYLHGDDSLEKSLHKCGFSVGDITDVFLTHLHFDHCGGSVRKVGEKLEVTFPNARYWSNEAHWKWATEPNPREKASFLKENIDPIKASGQLELVNPDQPSPFSSVEILYTHGHTDGMMHPVIRYKGHSICFVSDLIPTSSHIPVPYVMGYDTRPLLTMDEKSKFLERAASESMILFFEHDPKVECCTVTQTEKGVRKKDVLRLEDL